MFFIDVDSSINNGEILKWDQLLLACNYGEHNLKMVSEAISCVLDYIRPKKNLYIETFQIFWVLNILCQALYMNFIEIYDDTS